jgi:hypothetical protein
MMNCICFLAAYLIFIFINFEKNDHQYLACVREVLGLDLGLIQLVQKPMLQAEVKRPQVWVGARFAC